jgi:hypothetical protein
MTLHTFNFLVKNNVEGDSLLGCCTLIMEAVSTSETSVNFYQTTGRNIPEVTFTHAAVRT